MTDKVQTPEYVGFVPQAAFPQRLFYYNKSVAVVHQLIVGEQPIWVSVLRKEDQDVLWIGLYPTMMDAVKAFKYFDCGEPNKDSLIFEERLKISAEYSMMSPFIYKGKKLWLVIDVMHKSIMVTNDIDEPLNTYLPG